MLSPFSMQLPSMMISLRTAGKCSKSNTVAHESSAYSDLFILKFELIILAVSFMIQRQVFVV